MNANYKGLKLTMVGMLIGLLAAASATGQGRPSAPGASAHSIAPADSRVFAGLPRQVLLPDGAVLTLEADGLTLTLRHGQQKPAVRMQRLPLPRINASLTLLPSGRVLIWGGTGDDGQLQPDGVWFDPQLRVLTPADDLPIAARASHTATVLTDGRVLFAGGRSDGQSAELWDERSNESAQVAGQILGSARAGHKAQLQSDGKVHISGGRSINGPLSPDVMFDPTTSRFTERRSVADAVSAPGIAGALPAQSAQSVLPTSRLSVRFTQPARMDDLNRASVTLLGPGGPAAIEVMPVEGGRLVFATPRQDLFPDSRYTLLINGVQTLSGKPVPLITVDFKTTALAASSNDADSGRQGSGTLPPPGAERSTGGKGGAHSCAQSGGRKFPCADSSVLKDGVWTPGRDSTDGRWRVQGSQPELMSTQIMAKVTEALGYTTVVGRILQVDAQPVADVEVSVGGLTTRTNQAGEFILYNPPAGKQELYVDGTTANRPGVEYGQFVVGVQVEAGRLTQLPYTMYLPRVTARDKIKIPSPLVRDLVLTHPDMPGLQVQIPAGTVIRDRKGRLVRELAIVPTPVNRAPFPVADNYPMYFTLEPGGAVIQGLTPEAAKGIRVFYPNYDNHPKGTQANFWIYDPAEGWRVYGKGRVTSDGTRFAPEAGVALHQTMGGSYSVSTNEPPTEPDKPPCSEACGSAQSGGGATAGDPIDLRTGEFFYSETDIAIKDVVPITLSRHYRPHDIKRREFGIGTGAEFNFKLHSPGGSDYTRLQLILPSGVPVDFQRISGSGYTGKWAQAGTSTVYTGAHLEFLNDALGKGYRLTTTDGTMMHFGNLAPNPLQWSQDRYGNRTEYVFDAGLISRIVSPSGRYIQLEYDSNNRIQTARDSMGHAWSYQYNGTGLLSKVIYPDTTFKSYNYKVTQLMGQPLMARLESIYDQKGQRILLNEFEQIGLNQDGSGPGWSGRVVKQTQADGGVIGINYAHVDGATTGTLVTQPDGSKRRIVFETTHPYPKTDTVGYGTPLAQTVEFVRNAAGQMTARVDALGRRTEYRYNASGQVTQVIALAGTAQARTVKVAYNSVGDPITLTDALNRVTTLGYSNRCLTSVKNPLGQTTKLSCNIAGQPVSVTDPLNRVTTFQYQGYDLDKVIDPLGRAVSFRYDALGRVIAAQDAEGNLSRTQYDAMGRVGKSIDASGSETSIGYDANGNVLAVLLPHGNGVTYTYDNRDRLKTRTDGLSQVEAWTYDLMDRVKTYRDRKAQTTGFAYDTLGRATVTTYADGSTATATFDAANRLRTLVDSVSGTLGWEYNDFDELITASSPQGNVFYTYDAASRRTSMLAASQPKVDYQYDAADRLTRILQGSEVVQHAYDAAGRLTETTLPNGIKTGYAYNHANQVTGIAWMKPDSTLLGDLGYGYNPVGRLVAQTGSFASQTLPAPSTGNAFDDNQRQTKFNNATLTYDANGNLTSDGTRTYVWNVRDQLVQVKQGASVIASFGYDAMGRRYSRTEGGTTVAYLYDGLDAVQETTGTNINPILTGLGIDQRHARNDNSGRTYFLTDALGSTRALTNASGAVVNRYDYDPYGTTTQTATGFSNPYQYTGRERDSNGMYYYRARYYRPNMGRFISEDPLGLADGWNPYAYVGGNPVSYVDPTGEFGVPGAIYGAIAGGVGGYISSGSWQGALLGAGAGAIVGAINPFAASAAGGAAGGVAASLIGQAAGNAVSGKDVTSLCNYDLIAAAGAGLGGALGGPANKVIGKFVDPYRGQVIGSKVGSQTLNYTPGNTVGSIAEGVIGGIGEWGGSKLSGGPGLGCGCG